MASYSTKLSKVGIVDCFKVKRRYRRSLAAVSRAKFPSLLAFSCIKLTMLLNLWCVRTSPQSCKTIVILV